eukprot:2736503-Lingulodinium_polyedra.AAC.1
MRWRAASYSTCTNFGGSPRDSKKRSLEAARMLKLAIVRARPRRACLTSFVAAPMPPNAFLKHFSSSTGPKE